MMGKIILHKTAELLLTVIMVSMFLFSFFFFLGGDSSSVILGEEVTQEARTAYREKSDRDRGFFSLYLSSMRNFITLNWGNSASGESIRDVVAVSFPVSLSLAFYALLFSFPFSLILSIKAAGGSRAASFLSSLLSSLFLLLPSFLSSVILLIVFSSVLHVFPVAGYMRLSSGVMNHLRTVILPSLALSFVNTSFMLRLFGEALRENMAKPFVNYERAKGVNEKMLCVKSALKPSLSVIISATAQSVVSFFASSTVVETVFALPGMGRALVRSASSRDSSLSFVLVMIDVLVICGVLFVSRMLIALIDRRGERENGKA